MLYGRPLKKLVIKEYTASDLLKSLRAISDVLKREMLGYNVIVELNIHLHAKQYN